MWRSLASPGRSSLLHAVLRPGAPLRAVPLPPASLAAEGGGNFFAEPLSAELLQLTRGPFAPLQVRWAKKSKRRRRPKMADRSAESTQASGGQKERIFDRYLMAPETSFEVARQIRSHMRGLVSDGRRNARRKKDLARYTNYRVMRAAGLTHDSPDEEVDRRGFVTPLTELQDTSNLPRSPAHRRFLFPHTLSYKVYWGPPSVMDEPNEYEGSMVGCSLSACLDDLPLTQQQKERLVDIVGADRVDQDTNVLSIEADYFPERNHNAAILGDMLESLLREASSVGQPEGLDAAEEQQLDAGPRPNS